MSAHKDIKITKAELETLYFDMAKSLGQIADTFGVCKGTICYYFDKFGIDKRSSRDGLKTLYAQGLKPHNWKSGRWYDKRGYTRVVTDNGYTYEHRKIWESINGSIPEGYVIHHVNHNTCDNNPANIVAVSRADHVRLHKPRLGTGRAVVGEGN